MTEATLDALLSEGRTFHPPAELADRAVAMKQRRESAKKDRIAYWESQARELDWLTPVCRRNPQRFGELS